MFRDTSVPSQESLAGAWICCQAGFSREKSMDCTFCSFCCFWYGWPSLSILTVYWAGFLRQFRNLKVWMISVASVVLKVSCFWFWFATPFSCNQQMKSPSSGLFKVNLLWKSPLIKGRQLTSNPNSDLGGILKLVGLKVTFSLSVTKYSLLIRTYYYNGF